MAHLALTLLLGITIAIASLAGGLLTIGGAIAQCLSAVILFGLGGWQYTIPIAAFFILSSGLSRVYNDAKMGAQQIAAKGSRRDFAQVLANGGVATCVLIAAYFTRQESLYIGYLGAIAAATADTWGTEIGNLSRTPPVLVSTFYIVPPGTSGAISFPGTVAGLLGAVVIWLSGVAWIANEDRLQTFAAVTFGGMAGSFLDSLLGSTVQANYKCPVCGKTTEKARHCGISSTCVRGSSIVNNDLVNSLSTVLGAIMSGVVYSI